LLGDNVSSEIALLVRSLMRRDVVDTEEQASLESLLYRKRSFRKGDLIARAGARPTEVSLIVSGVAVRFGIAEGRRQITGLQIAGNIVDLHAMLLKELDQDIMALTDCTVALIGHSSLKRLMTHHPHLARLLWLSVVVDGAIEREWLTGMRRRSSLANLAHLICELYLRLESMGLADERRYIFPATQEDVADVLGISTVHANRTVQDLRRTGLVTRTDHEVHILDFEQLANVGQFDPAYLNLRRESR
jgi:CRP-like cAMP-binding protein